MITLKTDKYRNFSPNTYNNIISNLQFHRLTCPGCKHKSTLFIHGYYRRFLNVPGGKVVFRICRVKCKSCNKTHALLPSFLVPYSQTSLPDHIAVIDAYESDEKTASLLKSNRALDESTLRYITRKYSKYWKHRMLSYDLKTNPLSELVESCFSHFNKQFMQIKLTPNLLFS